MHSERKMRNSKLSRAFLDSTRERPEAARPVLDAGRTQFGTLASNFIEARAASPYTVLQIAF
jgi:hypothetical protein